MQYDAITLDTNLFNHNSFNLEGGMLGQLTQFREGSAMLVLSEIVIREVNKYLKEKAKNARDKLGQAIKEARESGVLSGDAMEALEKSHQDALLPEEAARKRLNRFAADTNLSVVAGHDVDVKELIRRYFSPAPPFEGSGKKKSEFPDAIALITLEAWARKHSKHILAISKDQGWQAYAKTSEFIDVEEDLAVALEKFQEDAEEAQAHFESLLKAADAEPATALRDELVSQLADAVGELAVETDASAGFNWEADESARLIYTDFKFLHNGSAYDFKVVQVGKRLIAAKVKLFVTAKAEADFTFSVYDSTDKDEVPMGSSSAQRLVDFEAFALVTFEGDFDNLDSVTCTAVEIVDTEITVNFGHIEPDWSDDDYDEDRWRVDE
ncbi:PIN domain-containing protein [Rhizobium sp. BR 315]|uniref:PIN domain-containing protein n=1 Tax=Rhizobium sp. BR 315 TaxID=3040014 RepID=UPI003D32C723